MIIKEGKILLGQRKSSHGAGEYSFPGGHLEYMESFEACARRETLEECGIEIQNVRLLFLGNLKSYAPKHYVQITLVADWRSGEPRVMEPEKIDGWAWHSMDALPEPKFSMIPCALEAYATGRNYYDA